MSDIWIRVRSLELIPQTKCQERKRDRDMDRYREWDKARGGLGSGREGKVEGQWDNENDIFNHIAKLLILELG